jgi:ESS family glutamate:Na+ symporter
MMIHIGYLAVFMFIAMIIRRSIPNFSRLRIPDAIIAGLLTLGAKPGIALLSQVGGLGLPPMNNARFTALAYHLLAVGFIALSLKKDTRQGRGRTAISAGLFNVVSYCIQGFIGLGVTLILIHTIYPDLFPGIGLLLPFGFAQGPMAGDMAIGWAQKVSPAGILAFPSTDAASTIGFSFSTIGFLWACFAGIPLMNLLIRRRKRRAESVTGFRIKPTAPQPKMPTEKRNLGQLVDRASTQLILIGIVYILVFLFLRGLSMGLGTIGAETGIIQTVIGIFWSLHFVLGAVIATLIAKIIHTMENRRIIKTPVTDNRLLQNIGGTAIDFMIAASIAAINIDILADYIVPILIITTAGGISVVLYTWFIVRKVWPETFVEHFVAFFGEQTGTIATGLALLRGVDPEFRTRAASDIVYGSAIALPFVAPLIFIATLPVEGFETGNSNLYWITLAAVFGYLALALVIWFLPPVQRYLTRFSKNDARGQG